MTPDEFAEAVGNRPVAREEAALAAAVFARPLRPLVNAAAIAWGVEAVSPGAFPSLLRATGTLRRRAVLFRPELPGECSWGLSMKGNSSRGHFFWSEALLFRWTPGPNRDGIPGEAETLDALETGWTPPIVVARMWHASAMGGLASFPGEVPESLPSALASIERALVPPTPFGRSISGIIESARRSLDARGEPAPDPAGNPFEAFARAAQSRRGLADWDGLAQEYRAALAARQPRLHPLPAP